MPSFLDKLRVGAATGSAGATGKKDGKDANMTWLQKLQHDEEPVQADGSDKFFGAENFGSTCYFNSMVQSLYYSVPFREMVLSYPIRCSKPTVLNDQEGNPRNLIRDANQTNGQALASPKKSAPSTAPIGKPEDKDSPDYKKKQAMTIGPVLDIDFDNAAAYGMTPSLFTCLKDTFEVVVAANSRTGVVSMPRFLEMLRQDHDMFRTAMHQDAHEFLNILLNGVIESVEAHTKDLEAEQQDSDGHGAEATMKHPLITASESKRKHADFQELFQGTLTSETRCLTCENVSQRDEPFMDLSVDLEQHSSVTSCLREFSQEEMLCERDKFSCDKCGTLQEAEKRMKIKRLPKILALHLKRFKYTEDLQRLQKLFHRVVYPYHLRLFNTTNDAEDPDKLYELYAVVVHIGSGPYHGHYVAIIKTPERGWLLFDDESVEPVDKSYVKNFFGAQPGMACAYVLFYQETTLEAVKKEQDMEAMASAREAAESRQPLAKDGKESHGLSLAGMGIKLNGAPVSTSPTIPAHDDRGPALAHVVSAPAHMVSGHTVGAQPLSPKWDGFTTDALSPNGAASGGQAASPTSTPTKADKKQAAKEEKERKAAEKEREKAEKVAEKAEKARRKSMERSKSSAGAARTTIITGKKPETVLANANGSGDGAPSATSSGSAGNTVAATAGNTNILPAPAIPVASPQPMASTAFGGDEIAPAPLPSAAIRPLAAANENKPTQIPVHNTTSMATTAAVMANPSGAQSSPKEKDKDSSWPSFSSLSLRRSSKGSTGKKPKLWDRFGAGDSGKHAIAGAGAAGAGALALPPTSNPMSNPSSNPASTSAATPGSSSAPASSMPVPHPPISVQAAARGKNSMSDDFAIDETDSGTEGGVVGGNEHGLSDADSRPTSYDGGLVRVWRPPPKDKPLPAPPGHAHAIPTHTHNGHAHTIHAHKLPMVPPVPPIPTSAYNTSPIPPHSIFPPQVPPPISSSSQQAHAHAHPNPNATHAPPPRRDEPKPTGATAAATISAPTRHAIHPSPPSNHSPPASSLPPPDSLGTEVLPASKEGGAPKRRAFSSIRKKASTLLQ